MTDAEVDARAAELDAIVATIDPDVLTWATATTEQFVTQCRARGWSDLTIGSLLPLGFPFFAERPVQAVTLAAALSRRLL